MLHTRKLVLTVISRSALTRPSNPKIVYSDFCLRALITVVALSLRASFSIHRFITREIYRTSSLRTALSEFQNLPALDSFLGGGTISSQS